MKEEIKEETIAKEIEDYEKLGDVQETFVCIDND